jgi:tyrosine--tRNA ligase
MNALLTDLKNRGLIQQTTDIEALSHALDVGPLTLYCGFDPTADSLHVGHLLPLLVLRRFQKAGHRPIALIGGATGLIGDPSFKNKERILNSEETVAAWVGALQKQLAHFLPQNEGQGALFLNNATWIAPMGILSFLRDIGKYFSVNAMMNKEAVKERLSRQEVGISFTEFSYALLQSYDFVILNRDYQCSLQIGGSDQWGNITSGIELVRRFNQEKNIHALTLPLVTKADGTKFGKSESGAIWLDKRKTSPYQFYQFWLQVADEDVYRYLAQFTDLSLETIARIKKQDKQSGKKPEAQMILAREMTYLVHGREAVEAAQRISQSLFTGDPQNLTEEDFTFLALDGLPVYSIKEGISLIHALKETALANSNNESRSFIQQKSVRLNGRLVIETDYVLGKEDQLFDRYTILARGKRNRALLVWEGT